MKALSSVLAAGCLLACSANQDTPSVQPSSVNVTAAKALRTTSATTKTDPSYWLFTNAQGQRVEVPTGFEIARDRGGEGVRDASGATIEATLIALCDRKVAEICSIGPKDWKREITSSTCFETGTRGDKIVWSRSQVAGEALYVLTITHPAKDRARFEEIIPRVDRSWKLPDVLDSDFYCGPPITDLSGDKDR